ncbi:cancer-related nucleoside-triphosphatase [Oreochromis aureus]|uniref:AAA+ ATPase domain-containing protein n=1 Tax=Oreochromis aureus TaxID=47969 RepID=A0A668ULP3_OREAU|nr:cancer-related nucleoside-triphosphatase [Oreochromis aureus]
MFKHVFLTGPPGVGKTTLVQKACEALVSSGVGVEGFYTEEVREGGRRVGFDVVTLTGARGHLSRIRDSRDSQPHARREYTVGQYVVDLPSFENLALPLFRNIGSADGSSSSSRKVFVIDEIGKMELFSQSFIRAVRQTLDSASCTILGTIPIPKGKPLGLVEEVRNRRDVKVFTVSKENRNAILQDILETLQECLKSKA